MSAEEILAIVRRFYWVIMNAGNLGVIVELAAPNFVFSGTTEPQAFHGPQGFKQLVTALHAAYPDVHITVEDLLAQGETVVSHWTASGTHTGNPLHSVMGDIPANGKAFIIDGMSWIHIVNGKIEELLINEDTLGLLTQIGAIPSRSAPTQPSSTKDNETLVGRYFNEVMNQKKLAVIDEIAAPNIIFRIPTLPEPVFGTQGFQQFVTGLHNAFPDIHFTVEREIADADRVAARWTITGTHRGTFLGIPPTGRQMHDQGVDLFRVAGNKIAEVWVNENDLGLMQQLGAIPTPVARTN